MGKVFLGGEFNYRRIAINPTRQFSFFGRGGGGLIEMTFGLVHARYSLPEWEALN